MERSARADDASASQTTSEEYFTPLLDKFQTLGLAPRKRFAEGSTENVIDGEALALFGVVVRGLVLLLSSVLFWISVLLKQRL